jgi:DNA-binding NarL/FixJ family response regulator
MEAVRVVVVDDDPLFADCLALTLATDTRIAVAGIAHDGLEALRLCRGRRPDVVLMDLHMPGLDGLETTRRLRETTPWVRVVMLTADDSAFLDSLEAGAVRFLHKGASLEQVRDAVVDVASAAPALPVPAAAYT